MSNMNKLKCAMFAAGVFAAALLAGPVAHGMRAALVRPDGRLRPGDELPDGALLIRHVRELPPLLRIA